MTTNTPSEHAYLSLLIRPENITPTDVAEALSRLLENESSAWRRQCQCDPPNIIHSLPVDQARTALELLRKLGCTAFAPTLNDLMALGPTNKIRDIALTSHGIEFDIWRTAEKVIIQPGDIDVIVQAKANESRIPTAGGISRSGSSKVAYVDIATAQLSSRHGISMNPYSHLALNPEDHATDLGLFTKLDVHTANGTVYQVDGDKFTFGILGSRRASTDLLNIDLICDFFAELAPKAAVDQYFQFFKPPADLHKFRLPRRKINNDNPAFAFYSRWAALMYRYLVKLPQ